MGVPRLEQLFLSPVLLSWKEDLRSCTYNTTQHNNLENHFHGKKGNDNDNELFVFGFMLIMFLRQKARGLKKPFTHLTKPQNRPAEGSAERQWLRWFCKASDLFDLLSS